MREKTHILPRTIFLLLAAIMLLTLSGCAGGNYVWYQGGKDRATFKKDYLQCEEESALYARNLDKQGNEEIILSRMKECLGLRGYLRVLEDDAPKGVEKF